MGSLFSSNSSSISPTICVQNVLYCQQTGYRAELIHHQRHMRMALPKFLQHLHQQRFGLGHDQRLAHDVGKVKRRGTAARAQRDPALVQQPQQDFEKDRADELYRLLLPDRHHRKQAFDQALDNFVD